jgi:hypothetical protein
VPELSILVVGNTDRAEFREARQLLERWGRVMAAADTSAAAAALAGGESPVDLIVVAQAFPGEFPAERGDSLRRLAPLARVVALLGSWCEGETRTGRACPGAIRVYWHQWAARAERELSRLCEGRCSAWSLPATASDEEQILVSAEEPIVKRQGLVAIYSARFEMHQWLAAACRRAGFTTAWLRPDRLDSPGPGRLGVPEPARVVLFDAADGRGEELKHLRRLSGRSTITPLSPCGRGAGGEGAGQRDGEAVVGRPLRAAAGRGNRSRVRGGRGQAHFLARSGPENEPVPGPG